jgi:hypothetical protein
MAIVELTRIVGLIAFGIILIFGIQPWLFQSQILFIGDQNVQTWLATQYQRAAYLVAGVSIVSTFLWYFLSSRAAISNIEDLKPWRLLWWILLLVPLVSIGGALAFFNTSRDAQLWLVILFLLNVIVLFWLPTAVGSPKPVKNVPLGGRTLRKFLDS